MEYLLKSGEFMECLLKSGELMEFLLEFGEIIARIQIVSLKVICPTTPKPTLSCTLPKLNKINLFLRQF